MWERLLGEYFWDQCERMKETGFKEKLSWDADSTKALANPTVSSEYWLVFYSCLKLKQGNWALIYLYQLTDEGGVSLGSFKTLGRKLRAS